MGFFFNSQAKGGKAHAASRAAKVDVATLHRMECKMCPLNSASHRAKCSTPSMPASGAEHPDLYVLGEYPSAQDDLKGAHYTGKENALFRQRFNADELEEEVRINYVVRTRTPKNRMPDAVELECCRPSIERDIAAAKPKVILVQGYLSTRWLLSYVAPSLLDGNKDQPAVWHGRWMPVSIGGHKCWATFTYSPSWVNSKHRHYTRRDGSEKEVESVFDSVYVAQVDNAMEWAQSPQLPRPKRVAQRRLTTGVETFNGGVNEFKRCMAALSKLKGAKKLAFDIETNGLRPYAGGAKILSMAVGDKHRSIAFALDHKGSLFSRRQRAKLAKECIAVLESAGAVVGQNVKFDLEWMAHFYGKDLAYSVNWEDTMAQAYILDNRQGGLSLEFQCAVEFGIDIKGISALDNSKLDSYPANEVLHYNALDVKWTLKLYHRLNRKLKAENLSEVYAMHVERTPSLALMQILGLPVDQKRVRLYQRRQAKRIAETERQIRSNPDFAKFAKKAVNSNIASTEVMANFFGVFMDMPEVKTDEGKVTTKKEIIENLDHPVATLLGEYRNQTKLKSTYLDNLSVEDGGKEVWPDGLIHTDYKGEFTSTGRLSSRDPNVQNFPKRKDVWVRKVVRPRRVKGQQMVMLAGDYGQLEARGIALASADDYLCRAVWQGYDVHMEWAQRIARQYPQRIGGKKFLDDKVVMKNFRTDIKNQWTFPAFYGASLYSISGYLNIPMDVLEPIFTDFWDTFEGVREWQRKLEKQYAKHGYVTTLTGRRRYAPLTNNELINAPIQGMGSDLVVDAMNRLSKHAARTRDWYLHPRINIHDDLTFIVPKPALDEYEQKIAMTMLDPERWDFLRIPLLVEFESGPDWGSLKSRSEYETPRFFPEFTMENVYDR